MIYLVSLLPITIILISHILSIRRQKEHTRCLKIELEQAQRYLDQARKDRDQYADEVVKIQSEYLDNLSAMLSKE